MADIGIANCTIQRRTEGGYQDILIITPLTADSADTVDVSTLVTDTQVCQVYGYDMITGDTVTTTIAPSTGVITIDAAGGTSNHTYAIKVTSVSFAVTVA